MFGPLHLFQPILLCIKSLIFFSWALQCIQIGFYYWVYFFFLHLFIIILFYEPVCFMSFLAFLTEHRCELNAYSVCNQRVSCSAAAMAWQQQANYSLKVTAADRQVVTQEDCSPPENTVDRSVAAVQVSSAIHYLVCWRSRILQISPITLEFTLDLYPNFAGIVTSRKYLLWGETGWKTKTWADGLRSSSRWWHLLLDRGSAALLLITSESCPNSKIPPYTIIQSVEMIPNDFILKSSKIT